LRQLRCVAVQQRISTLYSLLCVSPEVLVLKLHRLLACFSCCFRRYAARLLYITEQAGNITAHVLLYCCVSHLSCWSVSSTVSWHTAS
jgi:hypothetical protein